ncbi:MAG: glycosyltransferase family 8 protein [Victivallaceae bacterium]|nr:glycosyltransferase family 8 protein [Victivallaceae bacterium]
MEKTPDDSIHIVVATDEKYAIFCNVMIAGVLLSATNTARNIIFHIFHAGLSSQAQENIKSLQKLRDCCFLFHEITPESLAGIPTLPTLSPLANARLFLTDWLPDVSKVLYLDCDILPVKNIELLFDFNLQGFPIGACLDYGARRDELEALGFSLESYFNTGVCLMDLDVLRKMNFLELLETALANPYLRHDQALLNQIFKNRWLALPHCWNVQSLILRKLLAQYPEEMRRDFLDAQKDPAAIHFSGRKPTQYAFNGKYRSVFFKTLRHTAYAPFHYSDRNFRNFLRRWLPNWLLTSVVKVRNHIFVPK